MQEFQNVSLVLALLSLPDIIRDHVSGFLHAVDARALAAISGKCSCSAIARTCASVKPHNAIQSSNVIISRTAKCRTNGALIDPTPPAFASRTDRSRRDRLPKTAATTIPVVFATGARLPSLVAALLQQKCQTRVAGRVHERGSEFRREIAHCRSLISHSRLAVSVSCASGLGGVCS
jgi:hypothetical protein